MRKFDIKVDTDIINNCYSYVINDEFRYRSATDRNNLMGALELVEMNFKAVNGVSYTRVDELEVRVNQLLNDALEEGAIIIDGTPETTSLYKEELIEARFGIAFAESPYLVPDIQWYVTEERRDEVFDHIQKTGEFDTSTTHNPLGKTVKVYACAKVVLDLTIQRRVSDGQK